jgi:hypothetical protein
MNAPLIGSWKSVRSNIPDYIAGSEWLHFFPDKAHVWEVGQPDGRSRPSTTHFTLKKEGSGFLFQPLPIGEKPAIEAWKIKIERISARDIAVAPQHGFTTIFQRIEEEPNQALEPTSGTVTLSAGALIAPLPPVAHL